MRPFSAAARPVWRSPGTSNAKGLRLWCWRLDLKLGHTWRGRRDSLKLFTPAVYDGLPGMPFPAPADTYPTKDPVADSSRPM
ncbi:MAG TPA: hypothetical protein VKA58_13120 [Propionibacteriaceae bacterium]|jgi:hypothetical protein|nr:hypothetical protein [Propionibacteriaceae bacterium]